MQHLEPDPTFAFVGWNPFQFRHVAPIAAALPGGCMVVECRKNHPWTFSPRDLSGDDQAWLGWPAGRLAELDGLFDVIVCQSPFEGLHRFRRSRIAMIQYGLAKEPYNYGSWRSLADLHLTYGTYSAQRLARYGPAVPVGIPSFDRWHDEAYHAEVRKRWQGRLDPNKPTVAYVPTWGALSTSDAFADAVAQLGRDYNVVLKLHHNTALLKPKQRRRLHGITPHVLDQRHAILEAMVIAEVVLSDYSGGIFDAIYCGRPVVLLQRETLSHCRAKLDENSIELRQRHELGIVVENPSQLSDAVRAQLSSPQTPPAALVAELFDSRPGAVERAVKSLVSLAGGGSPGKTEEQLALRATEIAVVASGSPQRKRRVLEEIRAGLDRLRPTPALACDVGDGSRPEESRVAHELDVVSRRLATRLGRSVWVALGRAYQCARSGRHAEARRTLVLAQRGNPAQPRLLLAIGDAYRDDGRAADAHTYYRAAAAMGGPYDLVRKLSFESDWGRIDAGGETIRSLLEYPVEALLPLLPMINRVSSLYPDQQGELSTLRERAREAWRRQELRRVTDAQLELAMRCRWTPELRAIVEAGRRKPLSKLTSPQLRHVLDELGPLGNLTETAWHNEATGLEPRAWYAGAVRPLAQIEATPVEFFIPGAFFALSAEEKSTYPTIRRMFRSLFAALCDMPDVCVVPRMQTHWRRCQPRLGGLCISYHTRGPADLRRLHVQESTLAGRCSLDHAGYAGFSTMADEDAIAALLTARTPPQQAPHTAQDSLDTLREAYAHGGASKYTQPAHRDCIDDPYVFVPLQLVTDEVASLVWVDQLTMLHTVVEELSGCRIRTVVKRHPFCRSARVDQVLSQLRDQGRVLVATGTVHALISGAQAVVTANSGTGLEALMHGKPVLATGRCDYVLGTYACRDTGQLREQLRAVLTGSASPRPVAALLDYYLRRYTVNADDVEAIAERVGCWVSNSRGRVPPRAQDRGRAE